MRLLPLLLLAAFTVAAATPDFSKAVWEEISSDRGILVYRWEMPESDLFAFKADGIVEAPIARVASVLIDTSRRKEWVPNLIDAHIVRKINPHERIEYTSIRTPPFTKDRDFVLHAKAEYVAAKKELVLFFTSVEDPEVPETGMVRGRVIDSTYTLKPTDDNKKTYVEYRVHIDPRGSVAKWIVNLVQKSFPRRTLEAIRAQVAKPDVLDHPEVAELFK